MTSYKHWSYFNRSSYQHHLDNCIRDYPLYWFSCFTFSGDNNNGISLLVTLFSQRNHAIKI